MVIFKELKDFLGYFAGSDGNIYSNRPRGAQKGIQPLRKLKASVQTSGKYYIVSIKKNLDIKYKSQRVHRLICYAFWGSPISEKSTVSHLDGSWMNNNPDNLKWESYSENLSRKKEHGIDDVGFKNSRAGLNKYQIKNIKEMLKNSTLTHRSIGDIFKVSRVTITKIANGHRYKGQGDF